MAILFVRHGESKANRKLEVGDPATTLTETGFEQARATARRLQPRHVMAIISSPYPRARQTAETIADELGMARSEIHYVDELRERSMGDLEGKPKLHETSYFYSNDTEHGFESQAELISRQRTALTKVRQIARQTPGATVVVGHATAGFYLAQLAKGRRNVADFDSAQQLDNAAISELLPD